MPTTTPPKPELTSIDLLDLSRVQGGCGKRKQAACQCRVAAAPAPRPAPSGTEIATNVSISGYGV